MTTYTQKFSKEEIEQIIAAHIAGQFGKPVKPGFLSINSCGGEFSGVTLSFHVDMDYRPKQIEVEAQTVPAIDQSQLLALIAQQLQPPLTQSTGDK